MKASKRRLIFLIVYLAYSSIYVARVNLSMASPALIDAGVLTEVRIGLLGSVFSSVFAFGRLINGGLSDKRPPWQMITAGLAVAGVSNLIFGLFPPFIGMFILWAANAYAQSMLWSSVLCVVSAIYDKTKSGSRASLMVTSVATGNVLGILINTWLITLFGPRGAFIVPGILTLALGLAVFLLVHDIAPEPADNSKHVSVMSLLGNKRILMMCVPAAMHGVMKENITLWMSVYVAARYSVDLKKLAFYVLFIPVIGLVGRTAYTLVYRLCRGDEHNVSLIGFTLCIVASAALWTDALGMVGSVAALSVIYAAVSMINTSVVSIYPLRHLKSGNVASVSGVLDFATYIGAAVSGVIYGYVISEFGYTPMFVSWAAISAISFAVLVIFKKKYADK